MSQTVPDETLSLQSSASPVRLVRLQLTHLDFVFATFDIWPREPIKTCNDFTVLRFVQIKNNMFLRQSIIKNCVQPIPDYCLKTRIREKIS